MEIINTLLLIVTCIKVSAASGILFPRESEFREVKSLDGLWKFSISPSCDPDIGFRDCWFSTEHPEWMYMPVPSSYNDITVNATIRDFVGWAWYQRTFFVPKRWQKDFRVLVRFGSVHYNAMVWVNGKMAGSHCGGHLPFQLLVTDLLVYDVPNLITVVVNNTLTQQTIPQGSVEHTDDPDLYPPGYVLYSYEFDFFNYAGIHRPVYLYTTPETYIDDITITTYITGNSGAVEYEVVSNISGNDVPGPITCKISLFDDDSELAAPVSSECEGELYVKLVKPWWPVHMSSTPGRLYILEVHICKDGIEDVYRLPIGIRTIMWNNGILCINNKPIYLRGFGKHEDSNLRGKGLDYPLLARDHNLIEWVGANAYRTSHYPYAEEALDMADRLGILIIAESPAVNLDCFDDELLETHKAVMTELIERDKNRPSVLMWSLSNEARTCRDAAGLYYKLLVEHIKCLDASRPVAFVTNQQPECDKAAKYMDVIGVNRYFSWYTDTGRLELIPHQVETEINKWHCLFNKSIFMSEYGADSVAGLHQLPAFVWTEDYQAELLLQHFEAFDKLKAKGFFIGEMIWNFADFATKQDYKRVIGNRKGIFTRERQPKEAAYILRSRYKTLADLERCDD